MNSITMKSTLLLALTLLAAVFAEEQYTAEHDDLDIEGVVSDPEKLKAFVGCFDDTSECDEVMGSFKKDLPEAVEQACAKCTPAQKHILKRFVETLKADWLAEYEAFKSKYDPDNKHFASLEEALADA